ncbi:hypothetical protein PtB15_4B148 [Puccinia triticina]|nr:hypothetical protein PtB15_4B148 [Puccinia triticina]
MALTSRGFTGTRCLFIPLWKRAWQSFQLGNLSAVGSHIAKFYRFASFIGFGLIPNDQWTLDPPSA